MAIADDWSIDYSAKTVTHISGTTVYTVLSLYSWLIDVFDDAQIPPNVVPVKVTGVAVGDRVAVFLLDGVGDSIVTDLIDEEATGTTSQTTRTYTADEPVLIRIRRYGILPFQVEIVVGATGMSVAAIRTIAGIVS